MLLCLASCATNSVTVSTYDQIYLSKQDKLSLDTKKQILSHNLQVEADNK